MNAPLDWLLGALAVMAVGAVAPLLISLFYKGDCGRFSVILHVVGCLLGLVPAVAVVISGQEASLNLLWSMPLGEFALLLDPLAAFFLIPTLLVSLLAAVYGSESMRAQPRGSYTWFFYNLMVASLVLVLLAHDGLLFLVAWEIMSVTSFFLVLFEDQKPSVRKASLTYLTATHLGSLFLLALFALASGSAPNLSFPLAVEAAAAPPLLWLALLGFGTKAGFVPLHVWLPQAHPAAPSHVSAVLSGVIIKSGIYGLLRVTAWVGPPPFWWGVVLLLVGLSSGILGVVLALAQHNLKRLLAYHSVENIGIIAIGLGLGVIGLARGNPVLAVLGMAGGLLHVWNHSLFKSLLFLAAGAVGHSTHSLEIDELGGLARTMPRTALSFLVGAAAISGLPPFNGFVSEFLILLAGLEAMGSSSGAVVTAGIATLAGLGLISGLAVACFTKAYAAVFLGEGRSPHATGHDPGPGMTVPMLILATLCLVIGLAGPNLLTGLAHPVATATGLAATTVAESLSGAKAGLRGLSLVGGALLLLTAGLYWLSSRSGPVSSAPTWGCGYPRPSARMQYTAASFAQPLTSLFGFVVQARARGVAVQGPFPAQASWREHVPDVFEEYLIQPPLRLINRLAQAIRWLQHGRIQLYILYILVTLTLLMIVELL